MSSLCSYKVILLIGLLSDFDIFSSAENELEKLLEKDFQNPLQNQRLFIDKLFAKYGNTTVMTYEGFEHLMNGIEIGNIILDDSIDVHHYSNGTEFKQLHNKNHSHVININAQNTRRTRHADEKYHHPIPVRNSSDILEVCLSPKQLLHLYNIKEYDVITKEEFSFLCPALIYQLDQRRCLKMDVLIRYRDRKLPETTGNKAWGYGFGSILVISILGLLVVATVPLLQRISIEGILQFLISLAVGALTGDAMLHLIPHALSPHLEPVHGDDHAEANHNHENVYKGLCGLASMYFFFLIGRIQTIIAAKKKEKYNNKNVKVPEMKEILNTDEKVDLEKDYEMYGHHEHGHGHAHTETTSVSGMVWRVIVGDGIHNFSDGLAIGVAYANSITGGISTSIAVLCHELPHELGDFAVLLKKGVSVKKAIFFNCLSSVLSCIGMVIGVAVGNIGSISLWIFVAVGGMFIYISLVDMLPELTILLKKDIHPWLTLISQLCGLAIGTGIMLVIALYEEQIQRLVN